jgi:hypothetical protein
MRVSTVTLALLLLAAAGAGRAQTPTSQPDSVRPGSANRAHDWLVGGSVGVPGSGRGTELEWTTVGVQWTDFSPGRVGGDISIGTMPRVFAKGVFPLGLRMGITVPLENRAAGFAVLPSAGASLLAALAAGGGGSALGLNAGLATIIWSGPVGFRTGVTFHRFRESPQPVWLVEMGFVGAPASRR